jgi:4-alpha-glucanotransferase
MPIYAALDSADVWGNARLFQLDDNLLPLSVAGCPPDPFAAKGQLWGNPLYRWDVMEEDGFAWWIERLRLCHELFDVTRIDHFRGFEGYFSIPFGAADASRGKWMKGPGFAFIDALKAALPDAAIIAEDLGYLTTEVRALLAASGYPGMKVLQFAFDSREASDYMPYTYSRNCVVYTGTHDNATSAGWADTAVAEDAALALDYFGIKDKAGLGAAFVREALASVADLAVVPLQDWLGLGNEARMNTPSTTGSNWRWRAPSLERAFAKASTIKRLTQVCGRMLPAFHPPNDNPAAER